MEAVEALYKIRPSLLNYQSILRPLQEKNIKRMREYHSYPQVAHILETFTEKSFKEIKDNLNTFKYPVLSISYYAYEHANELPPPKRKDLKHLKKIANVILDNPLNDEEKRALKHCAQQLCFLRIWGIGEPFVYPGPCNDVSQETIEKYIH